ncbi:MAG: hypothetical protein ACLQLG_14935 [Thermoguttaceae bacterium]
MKPPNSLTDRQLIEYADEHIAYELMMLISGLTVLRAITPLKGHNWLAWACNAAWVTCYAVNARNMIDFLYLRTRWPRGEQGTDVVVEDYIAEDDVKRYLPPPTPTLEKARTKAHKQAAHLTSDRINTYVAGQKGWGAEGITREIMGAFGALAPHFPSNRTSVDFRQLLSQLGGRLPAVTISLPSASGTGLELLVKAAQGQLPAWPSTITSRCFR